LPARISANFAGGPMNDHSENGDELPILLVAGRRTVKPIEGSPFKVVLLPFSSFEQFCSRNMRPVF
jgi:hypothetical protein